MSEENGTSTNISVGGGRIDGDRPDLDLLRELSVAEYDKEFGETKPSEPKPSKHSTVSGEDLEVEETFDEEAEEKPEPEEKAESEEDKPEDDTEEGEESEEVSEDTPHLTAKTKDGKTLKVPKDALFDVKVDGKTEQMTAQQIVNAASGATQVHRKLTELGTKEAKLREEQAKFEESVNTTNDNLAMLQEIAESGNIVDLCEYYGLMTGKDPTATMQDLIKKSIEEAENFSRMTERERDLYNKTRGYELREKLAKREQERTSQKQTFEQERREVDEFLSSNNLTKQDFLDAASYVRDGIEKGTLKGKYSALDIAEYAVHHSHKKAVTEAISTVDKTLFTNTELVKKISQAIATGEAAQGSRFTPQQRQAIVKKAKESLTNGLSESLSKKVDRAKKSGKTNSQTANSRNQENRNAGAITLQEHRDRLYGGD